MCCSLRGSCLMCCSLRGSFLMCCSLRGPCLMYRLFFTGFINSVLSCKTWTPVSHATYSCYIIHYSFINISLYGTELGYYQTAASYPTLASWVIIIYSRFIYLMCAHHEFYINSYFYLFFAFIH